MSVSDDIIMADLFAFWDRAFRVRMRCLKRRRNVAVQEYTALFRWRENHRVEIYEERRVAELHGRLGKQVPCVPRAQLKPEHLQQRPTLFDASSGDEPDLVDIMAGRAPAPEDT